MNAKISQIIDQIKQLEVELEDLISKQQQNLNYRFDGAKIKIEASILKQQLALKVGIIPWLKMSRLRSLLSIPFIYGMILPLVLLHLSIEIYQVICFKLYNIPRVKRADYFVADRHQLPYLNIIEKFNCAYCTYGNAVIAYTAEIIARTELYWCPIKHARKKLGEHRHYHKFIAFGEHDKFHEKTKALRAQMSKGQDI